jgi:hypothetical protein
MKSINVKKSVQVSPLADGVVEIRYIGATGRLASLVLGLVFIFVIFLGMYLFMTYFKSLLAFFVFLGVTIFLFKKSMSTEKRLLVKPAEWIEFDGNRLSFSEIDTLVVYGSWFQAVCSGTRVTIAKTQDGRGDLPNAIMKAVIENSGRSFS